MTKMEFLAHEKTTMVIQSEDSKHYQVLIKNASDTHT